MVAEAVDCRGAGVLMQLGIQDRITPLKWRVLRQ